MLIWPWSKIRALEERVVHACKMADAMEAAHRAAEGRADALSRLLDAERERCGRLMREIIDLKRDGFHPAPQPSSAPPGDDLPPEVRSAILDRAGRDAHLAATLEEQARGDLARGAKPEEAAKGVLKGGDFDPWRE